MPLFQNVHPEEPRQLFAAGKGLAYYMEPPVLAAAPFVTHLQWTADGAALLAARFVPPTGAPPLAVAAARQTDGLEGMLKLHPRVQLVAWSRASGRSRPLLDLDADRATVREIAPMPRSDRALVLLSERTPSPDGTLSAPHAAYVLVAAGTGTVVRIWSGDEEARGTSILLSPSRPVGAIVRENPSAAPGVRQGQVAFFGPDGKVGAPVGFKGTFDFASDGGPGVATVGRKDGKPFMTFHRLDPRTGALGAEAVRDGWEEGTLEEPALDAREVGPPKDERGLYLLVAGGTPDEAGLVSTEGTRPALSPKHDAVAYLWGSGAYVRSLVKIDRKAYEAAMVEAGRTKAMGAAKQVGLAMRMYAADADDAFPLSEQRDSVDPYLKNRSALGSFTYTFAGGTLPGDPGTIVLGFVAGPGGRAVVYADGTVVWVPD